MHRHSEYWKEQKECNISFEKMQSGRRGMEVVVVVTSTVVYAYGRGWIPTSYLQELCSSKEYDSN